MTNAPGTDRREVGPEGSTEAGYVAAVDLGPPAADEVLKQVRGLSQGVSFTLVGVVVDFVIAHHDGEAIAAVVAFAPTKHFYLTL